MLDKVISYFSRLINADVDANTLIKLSSGQSARAHAWLTANKLKIDNLNLAAGFTISSLMAAENVVEFTGSTPAPKKANSSNSQSLFTMGNAVGVDIQSVSELFPCGIPYDPKSDTELLAIFTLKELSYAQSRVNPAQSLTGLFAAKEAILKCTTSPCAFNELEVLPDKNGRPSANGYKVSISHSLDFAVAIAMHDVETSFLDVAPVYGDEVIKANEKIEHKIKSQIRKLDIYLIFAISFAFILECARFFI